MNAFMSKETKTMLSEMTNEELRRFALSLATASESGGKVVFEYRGDKYEITIGMAVIG